MHCCLIICSESTSFCKDAFQLVNPQYVLAFRFIPLQVPTFAFVFIELPDVPASPFLPPVQAPLSNSPALYMLFTLWGCSQICWEHTLSHHLGCYKDIKRHLFQYWFLKGTTTSTHARSASALSSINHQFLSPAVQSISYAPYCLPVHTISQNFSTKETMRDCVKDLPNVKVWSNNHFVTESS